MATQDWTHVENSPIHGKGLFATRDIPKDTHVLTALGPRTQLFSIHTMWTYDDDDNEIGIRVTNKAKRVNHARPPNAAFFGTDLWTLRDIEQGEEITHDYGPAWDDVD